MRPVRAASTLGFTLLGLALASCGVEQADAPSHPSGGIDLAVAAQNLTTSSVVTVAVSCNQQNGLVPYGAHFTIPVGNDLATARARIEDLPTGTCDFDVAVYETSDVSQAPTFTGRSENVRIDPGVNPTLVIVLHGQIDANPFGNSAPYITQLLVSTTVVAPGGEVYLEVLAEDPDGDPLTFTWTHDGGSWTGGTNGDAAYVFWASPVQNALNLYNLGVTVADAAGATASLEKIQINVDDRYATGSTDFRFDLQFDQGPRVAGITVAQVDAEDPNWDPVRVHELTASAADFSTGSTIEYTWSAAASCGSFLVPAAGGAGTAWAASASGATVRFHAVDAQGCNVTVTAREMPAGGGTGAAGQGTIQLRKIDAQQVIEPRFLGAFQSATAVHGGQVVHLAIDVQIPGTTELPHVSWYTNGVPGVSASAPTWIDPAMPELGAHVTATWTAPACFSGPAELTLDAEDADGIVWNSYTFYVDGLDTNCP